MGYALRKDEIWREAVDTLREAVAREPAKVVALKLDITPRHAVNLQQGECGASLPVFMAAALEYPKVRDMAARWLGFASVNDPRADATLDAIRRLVETLPESGDQA